MISRRSFLVNSAALSASSLLSLEPLAYADNAPPALVNAKAQFYLFLRAIVQGEGMTPDQNIVLNSTIMPFDIAADTPFYNEELFREYGDSTFRGGVEGIQASGAVLLATRFSSQYRVVLSVLTAQIDQSHPEIQNSLNDLQTRLGTATDALNKKLNEFDQEWSALAQSRGLVAGTPQYDLQYAAWLGQVRYADQIQTYTDNIDTINAKIDAARRNVYTPAQIAALDNLASMGRAYNVTRPWNANVERSYKTNGTPLTEVLLANPNFYVPAMFDSSPLIFPVGDLTAFLAATGTRGFDTVHQSFNLDASSSSWTASGGGSFLGFHLGGGGSGSSSMSRSMSQLNSLSISFKNLSEYLADRSAWFNPGVFQDASNFKLVKDRPELNNLQYIAVSLIIARGTTLVLKFSQATNASDWSQHSFAASGGASFLGISFGASGGNSSSNYSVSSSADGTTVTIQDGDSVARVLGVRVEPFMQPSANANLFVENLRHALTDQQNAVLKGKVSYLEFQKQKLAAAKANQK